MSIDKKNAKVVARTFFAQLKEGGYTSNQILEMAGEFIDLVTTDLKEAKPVAVNDSERTEVRANA